MPLGYRLPNVVVRSVMAFRRATTSFVLASGRESARAGATWVANAKTRQARSAILRAEGGTAIMVKNLT